MATVGDVAVAVRNVGQRLTQQMASFGWDPNQPISNWVGVQSPPITANTLTGYANIVASRIERLTKAQLETDGFGSWLGNLIPQLDQLQFNNLNQGQPTHVINAQAIIQMIDAAIPQPAPRDPKVNWEDIKDEKTLLPRDLKARLRSVEARLKELEPRSKEIEKKIIDIENAHAAAEELPTDLAELAERRLELNELLSTSKELAAQISLDSENAKLAGDSLDKSIQSANQRISTTAAAADSVLEKSERALRGATSVGLSKAFEARKAALSRAGIWWTAGLAIALIVALLIGWERVTTLKEVLGGDKSSTIIIVNALLALVGIGAPIWFAWLSTKQIGTIFRLAEDYAFKASVAQAYEGFRSEAVEIDEAMRTRLFAATLDRFEEAPIRLVEPSHHSSPLQELLSNPSIRKSLEGVPNIGEKIMALVPLKGAGVAAAITPVAAAAALNGGISTDGEEGGDSREAKETD